MIRNIIAVISGYLLFSAGAVLLFFLTGIDSEVPARTSELLFIAVLSGPVALGAGYLTATVSGIKRILTVIVLTILIALVALFSLLAQPEVAHWTQWTTIVWLAPMTWLGGYFKLRS